MQVFQNPNFHLEVQLLSLAASPVIVREVTMCSPVPQHTAEPSSSVQF